MKHHETRLFSHANHHYDYDSSSFQVAVIAIGGVALECAKDSVCCK